MKMTEQQKQILEDAMKKMTFEEKMEMYEQAQKNVKRKAQKAELEKIKNDHKVKKVMLKLINKDDFIDEPEWKLAENPDIIEMRCGEDCFRVIKLDSLESLVKEYFENFDTNKIISRVFNKLFTELVDNERANLSSYINISIDCPSNQVAKLVNSNILFNDDGRFHTQIELRDTKYIVYYNHGAISSLLFL